MLKLIQKVIECLFGEWPLFCEAEKKRQEWYRNEIVNAYQSGDYERATFLTQEQERKLI